MRFLNDNFLYKVAWYSKVSICLLLSGIQIKLYWTTVLTETVRIFYKHYIRQNIEKLWGVVIWLVGALSNKQKST
jgi:hypothetical protein